MGLIAAFVSRNSFGWFEFQFMLACYGLDQTRYYFQVQGSCFQSLFVLLNLASCGSKVQVFPSVFFRFYVLYVVL